VGEISISDLAEKIIKITNSTSAIVKVPYTSAYPDGYEDMQRRVPNISKLNSLTGWSPKFNLDGAILDILGKD
jgi:UDP-glucose 4-epimerase